MTDKKELTWHIYLGEKGRALLEQIEQAVSEKKATSVSDFFKTAAQEKLDGEDLVRKLRRVLREELERVDLQPGERAKVEQDAYEKLEQLERSLGGGS